MLEIVFSKLGRESSALIVSLDSVGYGLNHSLDSSRFLAVSRLDFAPQLTNPSRLALQNFYWTARTRVDVGQS